MELSRRSFLNIPNLAAFAGFPRPDVAAQEIDPALHVLNRVTWGANAHDRAAIAEMGIAGYIDWQLNPDAIPDPRIDTFLAEHSVLTADVATIAAQAALDYGNVLFPALWGRIYRAAYSERQLYERVVEFWTDHFNIPIPDLLTEKVVDDRDVIRRHALGKFRDLLFASAQSPAMLRYLDNAVSDAEHPNENYARELLELHTLGVDGGYTEQDVREVARALTGWTVDNRYPAAFTFNSDMHDAAEKTILGHVFPAGRGIEDGLQLLDLLARHPSTARFISSKLCVRFVSDTPPASLIDSAAQVFTNTEGDIRQVLRHILTSAEFMAAAGQKFRRPIDFLAAALRTMSDSLTIVAPQDFMWVLEPMGQMPYFWFPPDGYPDTAEAWMSTGGLLQRWNLALNLPFAVYDWWHDTAVLDIEVLLPRTNTVGELVDLAIDRILHRAISPADRDRLIDFTSYGGGAETPADYRLRMDRAATLVGLLLASPYFQWI